MPDAEVLNATKEKFGNCAQLEADGQCVVWAPLCCGTCPEACLAVSFGSSRSCGGIAHGQKRYLHQAQWQIKQPLLALTLQQACTPLNNMGNNSILLIDAGECTVNTKAQHAQTAGAAGVILVRDWTETTAVDGMRVPVILITSEVGMQLKAWAAHSGSAGDAVLGCSGSKPDCKSSIGSTSMEISGGRDSILMAWEAVVTLSLGAGVEPRCSDSEQAELHQAGLLQSSLNERQIIVSLINPEVQIISNPCLQCVLASVGNVCGEDCLKEHLHIVRHDLIAPVHPITQCLLPFETRLRMEQAARLAQAIDRRQPFGLSSVNKMPLQLADLYLPVMSEMLLGSAVFMGVDTGYFAFICDTAHSQLAISSSQDRNTWRQCEGHLARIDLITGEARSQLEDAAVLRLLVHDGLGGCTDTLQNPPAVTQAMALDSSTASQCLLTRWFGPQVRLGNTVAKPQKITLTV